VWELRRSLSSMCRSGLRRIMYGLVRTSQLLQLRLGRGAAGRSLCGHLGRTLEQVQNGDVHGDWRCVGAAQKPTVHALSTTMRMIPADDAGVGPLGPRRLLRAPGTPCCQFGYR
jgi:hypothetical protein